MARRNATLKLQTLAEILAVWKDQLSQSVVVVPPSPDETGPLAGEFRLDLVLPIVGRIGPITCQVIQRMPDGGVAARIPDMPAKVSESMQAFQALLDEAKEILLAGGELQLPTLPAPAAPDEPEAAAGAADEPTGPSVVWPPRRSGPRGFPLPELAGRGAGLTGKTDDRSLRGGLLDLASRGLSGVLRLESPGQSTRFGFVQDGALVGWRAEPLIEDETLGSLLVRGRQLSEAQRAEALAIAERQGLRLGETLVALGLLPADQLGPLLGRQLEVQFRAAMTPRPGTWSFFELPLPAGDFAAPPMNVLGALHRALANHARNLPARNVEAAIAPRMQLFPDIKAEFRSLVAKATWTRAEQEVLLAIRRKPAKLAEVLKVDSTGVEGPIAVLSLLELGVLTLNTVAPKNVAAGDEAVAERIRAKRARVENDNFFDILELHWISSAADLDAAYEKVRNEFSRNAYVQLGSELTADVDVIAGQIQLAYNNLRDEVRRRRYRAEIIDAELMARVTAELVERGEAAIAAKNREVAVDCLAKASELDAENKAIKDALRRAQAIR